MQILVVVLSILLEFIVVSMAVPRGLMDWSSEVEGRWMLAMYGPEWTARLVAHARDSFDGIFRDSGIVDWSYYLLLPTEEEWDRGTPFQYVEKTTGMFAFLEGRLDVFWMEIAQDIQRFVQLGLWTTALSPVFLFLVVDGLCQRSLKKATFGYQSPFLHRYAMWATGSLWVILFALILLPTPLPPQTYPLAMLGQGLLLNVIAANIQKRI